LLLFADLLLMLSSLRKSNILILSILCLLISEQTALSHHGPFSTSEVEGVHSLHIGKAQLVDTSGKIATFGIRADSLEALSFVHPWFGCSFVSCSPPFKVEASKIIAFGAGTFDEKKEGAVGTALTVGMTVLAPLLLIPLSAAKGQSNFQYSLFIFTDNGRINVRNIRLYSSNDVQYLTQFLERATGKKSGDQPTSAELQTLRDALLKKYESEISSLLKDAKHHAVNAGLNCNKLLSTLDTPTGQNIDNRLIEYNNLRLVSGLQAVSLEVLSKNIACPPKSRQ